MAPQNKPDLSLVDFPMIHLGVKIQNQLSSQVSRGEPPALKTHTRDHLPPINTTVPATKRSHRPDKPFDTSGFKLKSSKQAPSTPHNEQDQQLQTLLTNLTLYTTHLSSHIEILSHSIRHAASTPGGEGGSEGEGDCGDKIVLERCNKLLEERDMLEAKLTVYTGHLKLGRMVKEGGCEGVLEFEREDGDGEGWGAWRLRVPRPGDWRGGGLEGEVEGDFRMGGGDWRGDSS